MDRSLNAPPRTGTLALATSRKKVSATALSRRRALISVIVVVGGWEIAVAVLKPSPTVMVGPSGIIKEFWALAQSGDLWMHTSTSLVQFLLGFLITAVAGIALGLLIGTSRRAEDYIDPWVTALYAAPMVAIAPLFLVWLGIGLPMHVAVIALVGFFPVVMNTTTGVHAVQREIRDVGRVFRASPLETFAYILVPAAFPFILSGLRLAVGRGLVGVVVADLFAAYAGLGWMISAAAQQARPARILIGTIVLAIMGVIITALLKWAGELIIPKRAAILVR